MRANEIRVEIKTLNQYFRLITLGFMHIKICILENLFVQNHDHKNNGDIREVVFRINI